MVQNLHTFPVRANTSHLFDKALLLIQDHPTPGHHLHPQKFHRDPKHHSHFYHQNLLPLPNYKDLLLHQNTNHFSHQHSYIGLCHHLHLSHMELHIGFLDQRFAYTLQDDAIQTNLGNRLNHYLST